MGKIERHFLEIKEISEAGVFEGILSPYGNVDEGGDVVEQGAYTKTLREGGITRPLLYRHEDPVGELTLEDRKDGLWCHGQLLMDLLQAQEVYKLVRARIVKGLSIGFKALKAPIESGVRHLKEIKLFEGSLVVFPMNELAIITSVKARHGSGIKGDFNEELNQIQTLNAFNDTQTALSNALRSLIWSDMDRDEKISSAETILGQFSEAFLAFWPDYLDALTEMWGPMENWSKERFELKVGAMISGTNKTTIRGACEKLMNAHDSLLALTEDEAADKGTSPEEAATTQPSEPEDDHSAVQTLEEIRELIPR